MSAGPAQIVGREAELERFEGVLEALVSGAPGWVALAGDPGIGKSRLLAELRERAEAQGLLVLSGSAAEFERDVPFSVWVDALDAYVASQDVSDSAAWSDELAAELAEILPSVRRAGAADGTGVADERYRAHRAIRGLLEILAAEQPLVLILDDLHWADAASAELIASLVRRGPSGPVLVAVAFRPGQAPQRLVAALSAQVITRIVVAPLSEAEAAEKLGAVSAPTLAAIYHHTGGNPFYLEQLARAGDLDQVGASLEAGGTSGAGTGVPAAVVASIADELESLGAEARTLLQAAAVAGEPFEPELAAVLAELEPGVGLVALDELLAADLVRPTQVPRRFSFRHPLVRRAVYESVPGGWRLAAHARAAAALAARGAAATERAHHVEQAANQGDEEAIGLMIEAGEESSARAPAAAARWFEAALRLLPDQDHERQVDLRVRLAKALRSLGELERCRDTLMEVLELLPAGPGPLRTEVTAMCASVEHWLGRHDEAHARLLRAYEELPDKSSAEAAALQIEMAVDALYTRDEVLVVEMASAALETARALGDPALIAAAAAALALGEVSGGSTDAAREHRDEALRHLDGLTDAELAPRLEALYCLGWTETYLERYDDAVAHAERGIAIARATGEVQLLVPMMLMRGAPLEMQGRLAEAIEACEQGVEAARLSAHPHFLFWALFELCWAEYFAGHLDAVIAAGEESVRVGGRIAGATMPSAGGGPGWAMAVARFELGEHERALEEMHAAGGGPNLENWLPVERCFNWENLVMAEIALGRLDAAEEWAGRGEDNAEGLGTQLPACQSTRARAALLLAQGDAAAAAEKAHESIHAATAIGATLQAAFSRSLLGKALIAAGDRPGAVAALREAEHELDACGSVRARDEVRRELRKLGARAEPRGPAAGESGLASLSKRELEIASLVTDRMTNREIAAALFLSDKTVESHVRNIFMKLGLSSRVDVARAVERERREQTG